METLKQKMLEAIFVKTGGREENPKIAEICAEIAEKHFNQTSSEESKELYYIQNEGFCGNALFWWGVNHKGYVTDIRKAGKYTREEAQRICQREEDHAYPCEYIDNLLEAQKLIIDTQYVDRKQEVKFNNEETINFVGNLVQKKLKHE